jgi:ATP-dependent Lon protease
MRDDTAFMDRVHAYAPGWEFSKLDPRTHFTSHFGLVSDFLSECWTRLRSGVASLRCMIVCTLVGP